MLAIARENQPVEITRRVESFHTSAFAIDLPDNAAETVLGIRLLHHIGLAEHRLAMLREFHRVARASRHDISQLRRHSSGLDKGDARHFLERYAQCLAQRSAVTAMWLPQYGSVGTGMQPPIQVAVLTSPPRWHQIGRVIPAAP